MNTQKNIINEYLSFRTNHRKKTIKRKKQNVTHDGNYFF